MLRQAQYAMDAAAPPQIAITITARFGRVAWKYSSLAYSLILKDVGVLLQTLYLMATGVQTEIKYLNPITNLRLGGDPNHVMLKLFRSYWNL